MQTMREDACALYYAHVQTCKQSLIIHLLFMKHFKKLLPALVLVMAAVISFAFRPVEKRSSAVSDCVWYVYTGVQPATKASAHDPANYDVLTGDPDETCPGGSFLCAICVPPSEIYGNEGNNPFKPKVDINTTEIYDTIEDAFVTGTGGNPDHWQTVDERTTDNSAVFTFTNE